MENHLKTGGEDRTIRSQNELLAPTEQVLSIFQEIKLKRKYRAVIFRCHGDSIVVHETTPSSSTSHETIATLPETECRYMVYDHNATSDDGRLISKLFFLTWLPHNATPSMKMAYTHGKGMLITHFKGCYDITASTQEDVKTCMGIKEDVDKQDSGSDFEDDE